MTIRQVILAVMLLTVGGCGQRAGSPRSENYEDSLALSVREPPQARAQIAYLYTLACRLRSADIASLQERQLAVCRSLGPQRCLVLKSSTANDEDGTARGEASLVIDARLAPAFNRRLDVVAANADGVLSSRSVSGVDVTKDVIDADAAVRAKEALAVRLITLIQTARGGVGELVAAEKAYADTQEQLDAARGLQAELRRRVMMSRIEITYSAAEATGALAPVNQAISSAGATLGESLRVLITAVIALLPWALVWLLLRWVARRLGWRGPIRRLRDWRARSTPAD